jgi:hypothetical protein
MYNFATTWILPGQSRVYLSEDLVQIIPMQAGSSAKVSTIHSRQFHCCHMVCCTIADIDKAEAIVRQSIAKWSTMLQQTKKAYVCYAKVA